MSEWMQTSSLLRITDDPIWNTASCWNVDHFGSIFMLNVLFLDFVEDEEISFPGIDFLATQELAAWIYLAKNYGGNYVLLLNHERKFFILSEKLKVFFLLFALCHTSCITLVQWWSLDGPNGIGSC